MQDDPRLRLVRLLRTVTVELDLFGAEFARRHQVHPTDVRALIHLLDAARAGTAATPTWLAEQLGLDPSSVTALVDRMERAGHVRRRRDPLDRRRVLLEVDEPAMTMGVSFFGPLIEQMLTAMRPMDRAQLATVEDFLTDMAQVVVACRRTPDAPLA